MDGPVLPRRALLRHVWAMLQTRAEAAALVVKLQKSALQRGLVLYAVAGLMGSAFATAAIVLVAVAAPAEWRVLALGAITLALLGATLWAGFGASRQLRRDDALIADFTRGLRLDLAMVSLALKDPVPDDEAELTARENAKGAVREAAAEKAATPSTAEGGDAQPTANGPSAAAASAAIRAAAPAPDPGLHRKDPAATSAVAAASVATSLVGTAGRDLPLEPAREPETVAAALADRESEIELPPPSVMRPEAMATTPAKERASRHGST